MNDASRLHSASILLLYQIRQAIMKKDAGMNLEKNGQFQIGFTVEDTLTHETVKFHFKHTRHSHLRACQRSIGSLKINTALQYGTSVYKQGLIYFILGENNIPEALIKQKEQLKNTVVIVAGDSNEVITCYRSANPFKNIRTKSERLCKKYNHAA